MLVLDELELKVVDHFKLTANYFTMGEYEGKRDVVLDYADIATFCMHEGYGHRVYDKLSAGALMDEICHKICVDEDSISSEYAAAWLLSHYFTEEQLMGMKADDAEKFLKDWKYWFGFRKCDGRGDVHINDALKVKSGDWVFHPIKIEGDEAEIWYVDKDNLDWVLEQEKSEED